jgi:hypothetical protein
MQEFDFVTNARVVAERKGITEDQAMESLRKMESEASSPWKFKMMVNNYMECRKKEGNGGPTGVDTIDPVHHIKE